MKKTVSSALILMLVVLGAIWYGKREQRAADRVQMQLDSAVTADSAHRRAAAQHDSLLRDSLVHKDAAVRAGLAQANKIARIGDSLAQALRTSLTASQKEQLDSVLSNHAAEVATLRAAVDTARAAEAQALQLATFWRLQNDTTQQKLNQLRKDYAKVAKRPARCGPTINGPGAGTSGFAWASVSFGCRL